MHRRRTALTVSALALLTASPLLTACSDQSHPGAAAVVGGDRITVSQLQAQVKDVRAAQGGSEQSAQLIGGTGQLGRATLNSMIFDRILDRAAKDAGLTVSRKEIQQTQGMAEQQAGGAAQLRKMWLQQYGIAPGQIDSQIRNQVAMEKLAKSLGADRNTPAGQTQIVGALSKASKALNIDVNPRYGKWDSKQIQLGTAKDAWLRTDPATAKKEQAAAAEEQAQAQQQGQQ